MIGFYRLIFLCFSIFILLKSISYSLYEIKEKQNKTGGIAVISITIATLILTNIFIFIR